MYLKRLASKPVVSPQSWTLRRCTFALEALLRQTVIPLKLCLLIDGLDEFDGGYESDHDELAELFKDISRSNATTSRFVSRLEYLTYRYIELYVTDKFNRSGALQRLLRQEPKSGLELVHEIVVRAQGVFLWVRIVVKSLLDGIQNQDSMEDLWTRLRLLPGELEPLYNHLLGLIGPVYSKWGSMAFQVVRLARELSSNPFGDGFDTPNGVIPLTLSSLYFALDKSVKYTAVKKMTHKDLAEKCVATSTQITTRCAGFLELSRSNNEAGVQPSSFVHYLHRTARDFVEGANHWPKVIADTAETAFDPSVVMMKSCLCSLNINCRAATAIEPKWTLSKEPETRKLAMTFMIYANYADAHAKSHDLQTKTFDIFDNLMTRHLDKRETDEGALHWSNDLYTREVNDARVTSLLELATLFNLTGYVDRKIEGIQPEIATSLLSFLLLPPQERPRASGQNDVLPSEDSYAWCDTCRQTYEPMDKSDKAHETLYLLTARDKSLPQKWDGIGVPRPRAKMVSLLLFHGADPNWTRGEKSAWENILAVVSNLLGPPKHIQQAPIAAKEELSDYDSLGDGSSGDEFHEKETFENKNDVCSGELTENYKNSSFARVR